MRVLGAIQSQDYTNAKWGIGQRVAGCTDAEVDEAFNDGRILRTHVMRPTWHFVLPEDVRWMQELTAPRVKAMSAYYFRQADLDNATFAKAEGTVVRALQGGKHLTRAEIKKALEDAGVNADGLRLGHILMYVELDAIICSGAMKGKQQTYALLSERAPQAKSLPRGEALAKLAGRYFTGHGPALPQDFAWWSGLTIADAKAGIEMAKPKLQHEVIDGKTYWFAEKAETSFKKPLVHLLPNYDEFLIAYKDRPAAFDITGMTQVGMREMAFANHLITLDGKLLGGWRRIATKNGIEVETNYIKKLDKTQEQALQSAAERLSRFTGLPVTLKAKD